MDTMNIHEFQKLGYLQEINRQFLHPLGLSLVIKIDDQGNKDLHAINDHRDDAEGVMFKPRMLDKKKADFIAREMDKRGKIRLSQHGFILQPIE